ncbi:MAG TPA: LysR family transcriptional regulator [Xanthobacteraceae bacterium]|nr:LysR family transcriptional regulator [Xanthobacteraceae bacterium]
MDRTDWHLLECFRVAGQLQHVTRAAEQLGTSQPALSRSLARLQSDLGVQLFRRAGRSIRLTKPGELFLARVERALGEIDNGRRELADFKAADRGAVSLGFLRTLGARYIPELVRRFNLVQPAVRFAFVQNNSATVEAQLERGELDLIFVAVPPGHAGFGWTHVGDQQLTLIVPRGHRLARRRQVKLSDVANERFVSFKQGHAIRRMTDDLCKAAGFLPEISFEADDSSSVPGFVAAGFGVGIVPPEARGYADVASLKIVEPVARRPIGLAWMEGRYLSASAQLFRDFVTTAKSPSRLLLQQK